MVLLKFSKTIQSRNQLEWSSSFVRQAVKKWWQNKTVEALKDCKYRYEFIEVVIHIYFKDSRDRDIDNYMGSIAIKGIMDGLVKSGIIPNDDSRYLNYTITILTDKENPRTEVLIYGTEDREAKLK